MTDTGIVKIHGKEYQTVGKRIADLRVQHPDYQIETDILATGDKVLVRATIRDGEGNLIATDHAEEDRNVGNINSTSAVENAETSAVGRALAFLGKGGTEIASADEVAGAVAQQAQKEAYKASMACMSALLDHIDSVMAIKCSIADNDLSTAKESWQELSDDTKRDLWLATTKGGCFTTAEREVMKSNEWGAA